ncbi:Ral GTPase-activating protein subunit beta [Lamellibrachia satsuma]|nr:Ral GTPase-activating protein subunit beta [Lamellibrachia satsuma]
MYSEWASVQQQIQTDTTNISVLTNFPDVVGKEVANSVVKSLAQNLSLSAANNEEPSNLSSPGAVKWTMQVLCYGLNLPLTELETVKDCVNVYCEWFSALSAPHLCVPRPVIDDPNPYVRDMLHHLYNLFVPRPYEAAITPVPTTTGKVPPANQQAANIGLDLVNRQTILCHRVLRMIQSTVTESNVMTQETWDSLLKVLTRHQRHIACPPNCQRRPGGSVV